MKKNTQSLTLFIPVTNLTGIWKGDFEKLPANKTYQLIIDYPISRRATFPLKTGKKGMSLFQLLIQIGRAYEKVYEIEEKYQVWGHDIYDLQLEGLTINHLKKTITLDIGS
jgi:hypothetical protein